MPSLKKRSRLLHEFRDPKSKTERWIGHVDKWISEDDRRIAEDFLGRSPDRYWYPSWCGGKIRISYADL